MKFRIFCITCCCIFSLLNGFQSRYGRTSLKSAISNLYHKKSLNMAYDTIIKVDSTHEAKCSLQHDKGYSLVDYMKLPVSQYVCIKMPLDANLERLAGSENMFTLTVPPVTFFNLQVSPVIKCKVYTTADSVVIESKEVILGGSPYVVGLNGCYKINIKTVFKWLDTPQEKSIYSQSNIYVEVDPPAPFKFFGKSVLQTTGNLAMSIALRNIENQFVNNLAQNYELWCTDHEYRVTRAKAGEDSCPLPVETKTWTLQEIHPKQQSISSSSSSSISSPISQSLPAMEQKQQQPIKESVQSEPVSSQKQPPSKLMLKEKVQRLSLIKSNLKKYVMEDIDKIIDDLYNYIEQGDYNNKNSNSNSNSKSNKSASSDENVNNNDNKNIKNVNIISNNVISFSNTEDDERDDELDYDKAINLDAPTSLTDDICLIPGEPVVRIEEAPSNARRIFTGIDIASKVTDVWSVLTNYEDLHKVIPSLVKNEVVYRTSDGGARLSQVGGAKVLPGVTFTAKTVLDVNVYLEDNPIPLNMTADHLDDSITDDTAVRNFDRVLPLKRGVFPRPYAITRLEHRDITMQNVLNEGDFDFYQGIWRMQSLPNCSPDGTDACRLTYAVELRPKGFLPVKLIEGRIATDLRQNMMAIRKYVESKK